MRYLTTEEVLQLHEMLIQQSGGMPGILDRGKVESAVAQPKATFGGHELYHSLHEKSSALAYSLARNHGFNDGNKRIAHAAMETFLILNGFEIDATVDEQETQFLRLAANTITRDEFTTWVQQHIVPLTSDKGTANGS